MPIDESRFLPIDDSRFVSPPSARPTEHTETAPTRTPREAVTEYFTSGQAKKDFTARSLVEPALEAAGAVGGAALGATSGPFGMLAGGGLGAAAGRNISGLIYGDSVKDNIYGSIDAAREDMIWGGGAAAIGPAFKIIGRHVLGPLFGVTNDASLRAADIAREMNIPLGVVDVSSSKQWLGGAVKSVPVVVGVFPLAGTRLRKAGSDVQEALNREHTQILNEVAPNVTLSKLGIDFTNSAANIHRGELAIASHLYRAVESFTKEIGDPAIFPTSPIKEGISQHFTKENRTFQTGTGRYDVYGQEVTSTRNLERPIEHQELKRYLDDLSALPEEIPFSRLRVIQKDINALWVNRNAMSPSDKDLLRDVKQGIETSLQRFNSEPTDIVDHIFGGVRTIPAKITEEQGQNLRQLLDSANQFWAGLAMTYHHSSTAKIFERADKNIFSSGPFRKASITPDKLGEIFVKTRNPQALQELRLIVGEGEYNKFAGAALRRAGERSTFEAGGETFFDWERYRKSLGLNTPEGRETLEQLLRHTGVSVERFENLVDVGIMTQQVKLSDAATFVKRRLILSGVRGATGLASLGLSAMNPAGVPLGITALALVRYPISDFITSPKVLNWMTTALDPKTSDNVRAFALGSLANHIVEVEGREEITRRAEELHEKQKALRERAGF